MEPAIRHPGEVILSDILLPTHLSIRSAAERLQISSQLLSDVVQGLVPVEEGLAEALAREFGYSRGGWLALQAAWNRRRAGLLS